MAEFDLLTVAAAQASTPDHPYPRLVAHLTATPAGERDPFDPVPAFGDDEPDESAPLLRTSAGGDSADALTEMIAVLDAQRAYEANAGVFDVGKKLADRTLDVGRL